MDDMRAGQERDTAPSVGTFSLITSASKRASGNSNPVRPHRLAQPWTVYPASLIARRGDTAKTNPGDRLHKVSVRGHESIIDPGRLIPLTSSQRSMPVCNGVEKEKLLEWKDAMTTMPVGNDSGRIRLRELGETTERKSSTMLSL